MDLNSLMTIIFDMVASRFYWHSNTNNTKQIALVGCALTSGAREKKKKENLSEDVVVVTFKKNYSYCD